MYYHIIASSTQTWLMRIPVNKLTQTNFLCLALLLLIGSAMISPRVVSQDEPELLIDVSESDNWNESAESIVYEGKSYDITASTEDDPYILGVNITVLGTTYLTSLSEPLITIEIPSFETTDSITITATKTGYQPGTIELNVLKGELIIKTDRVTVNENTDFSVTVTNQDNNPIEDALVYVTEDSSPILTNQQGIAIVQAPEIEVFTTTTIQVIKSGYLPGTTTIRIQNVEGAIFSITESKFLQILPILLAILVVIIAVIFVLLKKRKDSPKPFENNVARTPDNSPSYHKEKQQHSRQESARYPETEKRTISTSSSEPRIEEIRIPVQAKKKETTILPEEQNNGQSTEEESKHQDDWFKGQDYMRYKIDELTGKIDQKTDGKWFEGEQDTKYKVDEALKKSLKKKKVDGDSVE
jgi:hypothetical protein